MRALVSDRAIVILGAPECETAGPAPAHRRPWNEVLRSGMGRRTGSVQSACAISTQREPPRVVASAMVRRRTSFRWFCKQQRRGVCHTSLSLERTIPRQTGRACEITFTSRILHVPMFWRWTRSRLAGRAARITLDAVGAADSHASFLRASLRISVSVSNNWPAFVV